MTKAYTTELAEWIESRKQTRKRDKNLVAFLAAKGDVSLAIQSGYSVKTIWEHLKATERIPFGYEAFRNYVNKYINQEKGKSAGSVSAVGSHKAKTSPAQTASGNKKESTKKPSEIGAFNYNPDMNIEDLL